MGKLKKKPKRRGIHGAILYLHVTPGVKVWLRNAAKRQSLAGKKHVSKSVMAERIFKAAARKPELFAEL
jgi:hypothetical protein